ncbi:hypothetical protein C21_03202 [Arenibacter sp. NBRC 103722]|nr:hypothetical protein C21_03202 [Arenibacter sp. NBRC 103722]
MLVVQIDDLVYDMVFVQCEAYSIYKPLMEHKIVRGKPFIGLAALDMIPKAELTVYGQNIKEIFPNRNLGPVQKDVGIKAFIKSIKIVVCYGQDFLFVQRNELHFSTVIDKGDGIVYGVHKTFDLIVQFLGNAMGHFTERIHIFGIVQCFVLGKDEKQKAPMFYILPTLEMLMCGLGQKGCIG